MTESRILRFEKPKDSPWLVLTVSDSVVLNSIVFDPVDLETPSSPFRFGSSNAHSQW
jgi:hypothetical protein